MGLVNIANNVLTATLHLVDNYTYNKALCNFWQNLGEKYSHNYLQSHKMFQDLTKEMSDYSNSEPGPGPV